MSKNDVPQEVSDAIDVIFAYVKNDTLTEPDLVLFVEALDESGNVEGILLVTFEPEAVVGLTSVIEEYAGELNAT